MSAKCSPSMYGVPYIFYFVHSIVKTVEMMVQRVDFEQNLKNICPTMVCGYKHICNFGEVGHKHISHMEGMEIDIIYV